jgi:ankyrin repeat protein
VLLNTPGINLNLSDLRGKTALQIATDNASVNSDGSIIVRMVQSALVNKKMAAPKKVASKIPLHQAAATGDMKQLQDLISGQKVSVNEHDHFCWTALMYAASNGQKEAVRFLIAKGADVNAGNFSGRTAKMMARQNGHTEIVDMLTEAQNSSSS